MKDMKSFEQDPPKCSASGPDICPKWHYCNVSSNRCKPCTDCSGNMARRAASDHCQKPLLCSEGKAWKCSDLYVKQPSNGEMTRYKDGYLGSTVITRCFVNNRIQEERLDCRLNDINNKLEWFGNFICVTQDPPDHFKVTPGTSSVPGTDFKTTPSVVNLATLVGVTSVAAVIALTLVVTVLVLLQKNKSNQLRDHPRSGCVQEVYPSSRGIRFSSTTLCPTQNSCSWHSSHLGSSQNNLSIPIQESQRPDLRRESGPPSPSLSLHLPLLEQPQCRRAASTNSCAETQPKLLEPEHETLLQHHNAAMDDADLGIHLTEHKRGQIEPPGDAMLASVTKYHSIESSPSDRRSLILASDLCEPQPGFQTSRYSICGVTSDQTRVKTTIYKEPVEHSWTDSMPCVINSLSESQSYVRLLSVGSSSDSDVMLHDARPTAASTSEVNITRVRISNSAIPGDYQTDLHCIRGELIENPTANEFSSDSLLMRTSPSLSDLNEQTHSLTQTESEKQESDDSGINSKAIV